MTRRLWWKAGSRTTVDGRAVAERLVLALALEEPRFCLN